ncbi:MAG: AraC family transcriptional regulator [Candidatus Margulisiibacteriota bacterium]
MNHSISIRASDARHQPRKGVHRHHHYEVLIIKSGGGHHVVDFESYQVQPNQVYFMRPGQVHEFSPDPSAVFYFIAFDKDEIMLTVPTALQSFDFFQSFHCQGPVEVDEVDYLIEQMADIQYELANPGSMQFQLLSGLLTVLLIKLQRKFKRFKANEIVGSNEIVTQFNMLIDDHECRYRFVKDYATHLHISTTYLNDIVKKVTGFPASFWINKKQITYAKQLLGNSSLNFKYISTELGFSDATHFARFFKLHTQQTPSVYRRSIKC